MKNSPFKICIILRCIKIHSFVARLELSIVPENIHSAVNQPYRTENIVTFEIIPFRVTRHYELEFLGRIKGIQFAW